MNRYVYAYCRQPRERSTILAFEKFPEIACPLRNAEIDHSSDDAIGMLATDAVITALQARIAARNEIPAPDTPSVVLADGFVVLSVQQAMKLELYRLFRENCHNMQEFADLIDRQETSARRMLNLRHPSIVSEIEAAVAAFGKIVVHKWGLEPSNERFHSGSLIMRTTVGFT